MDVIGIKLFGKNIAYPETGKITNLPVFSTATATAAVESTDGRHNEQCGCDHDRGLTMEEKNCLQEQRANREHLAEDQLSEKKQEDDNPKTPMADGADKGLKKPDKLLPCPRCNSMDTKFCYYNNYNVRQPRHFCKSCQRYWTAGGTMRNMPVGAGRRKNKNPTSHCQFITISEEAFQAANGIHSVPPKLLSFGSDSPDVDYRNKENRDDCSSGSTVTTSNSVSETIPERNGFHSHVPCIPGIPWSYNPWNPAIPVPAVCPAGYSPMSFYPSPYWNYIPWLPQTDSSILGKHSREGELMIPNGYEEPKKQRSSVLIPKTLRIDDPDEAAKSSIWSTLGIKNENIRIQGIFKAFRTKAEEKKEHPDITASPVLQANPAAFSRSLCFQERA
ncbi:hypothetical protein L1887_20715 [Cichorium endivia]|nr:hypothetical protein L1887_20715 [Cichorium endivia]